jgi:hypothetical protein
MPAKARRVAAATLVAFGHTFTNNPLTLFENQKSSMDKVSIFVQTESCNRKPVSDKNSCEIGNALHSNPANYRHGLLTLTAHGRYTVRIEAQGGVIRPRG